MNKFILLFLFVSLNAFSQSQTEPKNPLLRAEIAPAEDFKPYKSHWLVTFGFEGLKYDAPYDFKGARENFEPGDQELWGGRLGFGREFYLGAGFVTATKVEGYYVGTLFARRQDAGPDDVGEEVAYRKRTGQVFGADISQSLGFLFNMKTKNPFVEEWAFLTVQPYVEAGIGRGYAYGRQTYNFDTGAANIQESYQATFTDDLTSVRFGGGINFIESSGVFFFVKAFVNNFDITNRKLEGFSQPDDQARAPLPSSPEDVKIDPVMTYSLGGGYKF